MAYVGMNTQLARRLGNALQGATEGTDTVRRDVANALYLADLGSGVLAQLDGTADSFDRVGGTVLRSVELAEGLVADPERTSAELAVPVDTLLTHLSGQLGLAAPARVPDPAPPAATFPEVVLTAGGDPLTGLPGGTAPSLPAGIASERQPLLRDVIRIAVVGNSFLAGEGAGDYIAWGTGAGALPAEAHQSRQAGAIQAIEQLQASHPNATINVNYSAAAGQTETFPPLMGGDGPTFEVSFVAESGATSRSLLGLAGNHSDDPEAAQIGAVRGADIVVVETGGNDARVVDTLTAALLSPYEPNPIASPDDLGSRFDHLRDPGELAELERSIGQISERTRHVPDVLQRVFELADPDAQVLVLGYPNILAPLHPDGTSGPLNREGVSWPTTNLSPEELQGFARWGWTLDNTLQGYVAAANPRPGQSVAYLQQWGTWGPADTLGGTDAAAHELVGPWYSPTPESYHPNPLGQEHIAATLYQPLQNAVWNALGQPVQYGASDIFFPTPSGVHPVDVDEVLASVGQQSQPQVVAPGISFAVPGQPLSSDVLALPKFSPWQESDLDGLSLDLDSFGGYPPLDSSWAIAPWDTAPWAAGIGSGDPWADAWDGPVEMYTGETISVTDFL